MLEWFSPARTAKNTCPFCRAEFFPADDDSSDDDESNDGRGGEHMHEDEFHFTPLNELLEGPHPQFRRVMAEVLHLLDQSEALHHRNITILEENEGGLDQMILASEQVLILFKAFVRHRTTVSENIPAMIAAIMGQLYDDSLNRQRGDMDLPSLWDIRGPRLNLMLDPTVHGLIQLALERLVEIEENRYRDYLAILPREL